MAKSILLAFLLCVTVFASELHLTWHQNDDPSVASYSIYYGPTSLGYTHCVSVGTNTDLVLTNLATGFWYSSVTAQSSNGLESNFSPELKAMVGITNQILLVRWSPDMANWTNVAALTNPVVGQAGFWKTTLIVTNQ